MIGRGLTCGFVAIAVSIGSLGLTHAADAQTSAAPRRVEVLLVNFSPESKEAQAFREGLRDAGYVEGRDVVVEWRTASGDYARLPEVVAELVQRKIDVIVSDSTIGTRDLKRATSTIPIVMATVADPLGSGFVTSLAHPGGNVTGMSTMMTELSAKRLQLFKEAIPRIARVAILSNPDTPYVPKMVEHLKAAATSLSIELKFINLRTLEELDSAFSAVNRAHVQALYVIDDRLFSSHRMTLLKLVSKARLPAIYSSREFADAGGLISYGPNWANLFRRSAGYVDKLLKGAKPGDLPVEQSIKFELVVNLKTAKALGLTIPQSILVRADEVIR